MSAYLTVQLRWGGISNMTMYRSGWFIR